MPSIHTGLVSRVRTRSSGGNSRYLCVFLPIRWTKVHEGQEAVRIEENHDRVQFRSSAI